MPAQGRGGGEGQEMGEKAGGVADYMKQLCVERVGMYGLESGRRLRRQRGTG
jgi:hypothetical protein